MSHIIQISLPITTSAVLRLYI